MTYFIDRSNYIDLECIYEGNLIQDIYCDNFELTITNKHFRSFSDESSKGVPLNDDGLSFLLELTDWDTPLYGYHQIDFSDDTSDFLGCGVVLIAHSCDGETLGAVSYPKTGSSVIR